MNPFGDGSDGDLDIASGTYNLDLNHKYQFKSVHIHSGATLSTNNTTGAVLYMLCSGTFTLDAGGTIDVSNKVIPGDNTWSVTIDGTTYESPGVAAGANGNGASADQLGIQAKGFGGGGGGGNARTVSGGPILGGAGGNGGYPIGLPGAAVSTRATNTQTTYITGKDGANSAGGSGAAYAYSKVSGGLTAYVQSGNSGKGGTSYGSNGASATKGYYKYTNTTSGYLDYLWSEGGGGGAGGIAGRSGVNIVIWANQADLNGQIITSGSNGGNGGNGGNGFTSKSVDTSIVGGPGGGGGGGNGGNITLAYSISLTNNLTSIMTGGSGGASGSGPSYTSTDGANGALTITRKPYFVIESSISGSGTATLTYEIGSYSIVSGGSVSSLATYEAIYQGIAQKYYEYRIFNSDGTFRGIWSDVSAESDFGYSHGINQNSSEVDVTLGRSPNNTATVLDTLKDENGSVITDENSSNIMVQTMTANAVGPDTDVDLNYNVDIYAFYGGYDSLQDENGDDILDENSDQILTQFGAPNGKKVYAGYIAIYGLQYGAQTGVNVTVVPAATDMGQYVFIDSGNTTVSYTSTDPIQMARDAMDSYNSQGGEITYDVNSLPLSGESATYDFVLNTITDTLNQIIKLLPSGYYWYVDPGEKKLYIQTKSDTPDHTFYYEKHIAEMNLSKSITQLVNKVYFVGGTPDGSTTSLLKYYDNSTSVTDWRAGLDIMQNGSVTLATSAELLADQQIDEYKDPRYTTTVTIYDTAYDIETIKLGQMVGFKNFGTYVDDLVLQIVNLQRAKHSVQLSLDMIVPTDTKRLYELNKQLQEQQVQGVAVAPS